MRNHRPRRGTLLVLVALLAGCSDSSNDSVSPGVQSTDPDSVYTVANGCYSLLIGDRYLARSSGGDTYRLEEDGSRFRLRPSGLGKYLLYDEASGYLVADGVDLGRQLSLASDTRLEGNRVVFDNDFRSEGEWELLPAVDGRFLLRHVVSDTYLGVEANLVSEPEAAELALESFEGCAEFPELTVDATGEITVTEFDDGDLFGFVESHAHLFTNLAFGGGGIFHGAPFHPLGVEHALPDCDLVHGEGGRRDLVGAGFGEGGDINAILPALLTGMLPEKNHDTEGYPEFTDWPDAPGSPTHQMQYYKWIERAYLAGMRLLVQHATTNQFLCQLAVGVGSQSQRHDCNDMVNVDQILDATYALEQYVDALSGGPGKGWFRIVFSPAQAREQIRAGKLAVVLGIEVSDLFDCFLVPFGNFSSCTESDVLAQLDEYQARGVRVVFPVHKYDNGFSAGDGDRRVDFGNFGHTGHYTSYVQCPDELLTFDGGFDEGGVPLANLNLPRDVYDSPPPFDMSTVEEDLLGTLLPNIGLLTGGGLEGEYCQKHGLTALGEFLMMELMRRGLVIEVDHFPRKSYQRAYELLEQYDYPAMGTHGRNNNGRIYALGGMSKFGFGRCRVADTPATMDDGLQSRVALMRDAGAYEAEGFGFDLNGFAGAPRARFGERSRCADPQTDAGITYPFTSYSGDITLQQPVIGQRTLDFNTEGMAHLGLVAELIEDVRRDGVTDKELEPLFRSAEGYIRMWEKSERRGAQLSE